MVIRNLNGYWTYDYPKLYWKSNLRNPSSSITSVYSAVFKRWTDRSYTQMLISTNNGVYDYTFTSITSTIVVPWYDTIGWSITTSAGLLSLLDIKNMLQDPFRNNSYYFLLSPTKLYVGYDTFTEHTQAKTLLNTAMNCFATNENYFIVGGKGTSASIIYTPMVNYPGNFINASSSFSLMSTVNSVVASQSVILRRWVAVGVDTSTNNSIIYSDDGINWSAATNTYFTTGISVNWHNDHFIAIGSGGSSNAVYSYDGITWNSHTSASTLLSGATPARIQSYSNRMTKGITVSNSVNSDSSTSGQDLPPGIVGTVNDATYNFITSRDIYSAVWTYQGSKSSVFFNGAPYFIDYFDNIGLFIAAGAPDGNTPHSLATSSDGITWIGRGGRTGLFDTSAKCVAYNGSNLFVATGKGTSHSIATSTDGINWTGRGGVTGLFTLEVGKLHLEILYGSHYMIR